MNSQFEIVRINLDIKEDGTVALKNTTLQEYMLGDEVERETVFKRTIKYLSYNEVLDLQGIKDSNPGYGYTGEKFALLVFNEGILVTAESGDGTGTQTDKAKMISFDNFSDAVNYNGKEVKVKITSMF